MKADAIIEKILEDARQSASKTLAEAGETVEKMRAKAEEESAARKQAVVRLTEDSKPIEIFEGMV